MTLAQQILKTSVSRKLAGRPFTTTTETTNPCCRTTVPFSGIDCSDCPSQRFERKKSMKAYLIVMTEMQYEGLDGYLSFERGRPKADGDATRNETYLKHILAVNHESVLEHVSFNFIFAGIDRM